MTRSKSALEAERVELVRQGAVLPFPEPTVADELSQRVRQFRAAHYPALTDDYWGDWHWQLRHRVQRLEQLGSILRLSETERAAMAQPQGQRACAVTPYYLGLVSAEDPEQPLRRTVVPRMAEQLGGPDEAEEPVAERLGGPDEAEEPVAEQLHSPVPGLIHHHPNRALLLATSSCATLCQHCGPSRLDGRGVTSQGTRESWQPALEYLKGQPRVRDVLLSGGDPLTLEDEALAWLLRELRRIPHLELVRIATQVPMVLPQRITAGLVRILRRWHPVWISIHVTHPDELTREAASACARLADGGIPLGSQTVLMRGINDDERVLTDMMRRLVRLRVRPEYLSQFDSIRGPAQLRIPVERGLELVRQLQRHTGGHACPTFVIAAPVGEGKTPLWGAG